MIRLLRDAIAPSSDPRALAQAADALHQYLFWKSAQLARADVATLAALDTLIEALPSDVRKLIGPHESHEAPTDKSATSDVARAERVLRAYTMPEIAAATDLQKFRARLLQRFAEHPDDLDEISSWRRPPTEPSSS